MRAIVKEPGKAAEIRDIKNELGEFQSIVDGWIESFKFVNGVDLIVNEEGRLRNMKPNFKFGWGVVVGTAIFVGDAGTDFADITDEGIERVMDFLKWHTM